MKASSAFLAQEQQQRSALAAMKRIATELLLLMAAVFVACALLETTYPWLAWPRAFSEAAMVGAFADWFAVTALFRRPLGLPIPHTAIVSEKKERIGQDLGRFIRENFLSEEVLLKRLAELRPAKHIARWLADPEVAEDVVTRTAAALDRLLATLNDEDV